MPAHKKTEEEKQATRLKHVFRDAMEDLGFTQTELARRVGTDQPRISRLIRNPLKVEFGTVLKVANTLKVDLVSQKLVEMR